MQDPVAVTVVVPTRDRAASLLRLVASLIANDHPVRELIIVDQSSDDATQRALERLPYQEQLRYIRTATRGSANGRNIGIAAAKTEIIALTDDDCEVSPDWIREIIAAFDIDQRIGVVFGNVAAAPHDRAAGFIPEYRLNQPYLARSMSAKHRVEGISACMGVRRRVWQALEGFDPMLGNGAPLRSAAESDFTIRVLVAGFFVYETPSVRLVHHGFRSSAAGQVLIQNYWFGTGATFAKHLKCGTLAIWTLLVRLAWRWAFGRSAVAASLGGRLHKRARLVAFVRGLLAGCVMSVDRSKCIFVRVTD